MKNEIPITRKKQLYPKRGNTSAEMKAPDEKAAKVMMRMMLAILFSWNIGLGCWVKVRTK